jgi:hypothetical protein
MRNIFIKSALLFFILTLALPLSGQDSISKKEWRREQRLERRLALKQSDERLIVHGNFIYAFLSTTVTFEVGDRGILSAKLGLENNLGLDDHEFFVSSSAVYRLTPKSGIGVNYYGLSRSVTTITDQDYIFLRDTVPSGSSSRAFFNTRVFSMGYVYTLVENPNTFLGAYFNLYIMGVATGIRSDGLRINEQADVTAPLPNFGILGSFNLSPRCQIDSKLGYFSLNMPDFGGRLSNFSVNFIYYPWKWLGLSFGYEKFELRVNFEEELVNTIVEYHFRGPAFGVKMTF